MASRLLAAVALSLPLHLAAQYMRGVNVSQAEWGDPVLGILGSDYTYPTAPTFDYFAARALGFIRLQVQWERLQPAVGGDLASDQLGYLKKDVAWAKAAGAVISIVPHNQARYTIYQSGAENLCIVDNPCIGGVVNVTAADLADFWVKMSNEFKDEPGVAAYDLMNEPHDMAQGNWNTISQTVVSAIRANGDNKLLMIPGDGWSNATYWQSYNGATSWIADPANNFYYEAHEYFDSDYSGTYAKTYAEESAGNANFPQVGVLRVLPFLSWCTTNNVHCYLGEYGIPNNDPGWLTVLDNFLHALDQANVPGTYWAAGELWARVNYPLSVQPSDNFAIDQEQLPTLLAHLPPNAFRSAPAAASYGYTVAAGSLVAGYGKGLATGSGGTGFPWPDTLQNAQVQLTDSTGKVVRAPLLYASAGQLNYQVPAGIAAGLAATEVSVSGTVVANGTLLVTAIAPAIFTANSTGQGVPAAQIQRVHPDGTQPPPEDVFVYDPAQSQFIPAPISFNGDRLFLILYGTGFDKASGANGTTVIVGGKTASVTFSGPTPNYVGEDQVDAELPGTLAGAGAVAVSVTVDGQLANPVTISFQ